MLKTPQQFSLGISSYGSSSPISVLAFPKEYFNGANNYCPLSEGSFCIL
jgi:hypothetical protein